MPTATFFAHQFCRHKASPLWELSKIIFKALPEGYSVPVVNCVLRCEEVQECAVR
jgi:hypothetical protein